VAAVAWRGRLRSGQERGVTTIEFVLVAWLFLLLVLGGLQFGLWWHAQHVVLGAAQDAARLAAVEDGTPQAARARAVELLRVGLGRDAATATVDVRRDPEVARATVTARLRPVLPIGSGITLQASARAFAEHFRPSQPSATRASARGATP
jgi:Flp pilus assembly protein TadG